MIFNDINLLHPDLEPPCREFLAQCANANIKVKITETWRDPAREDALHAKGITSATGLTCKHCFMLNGKPASKAFDFAIYNTHGDYIADGADQLYLKAGELGESIGLEWGGRWHHPDFDHHQLKE